MFKFFFFFFFLHGLFLNVLYPKHNAYPFSHLTPIHHLFTIKLTRENYLLWKSQIVPYLKGQHLYGYLDGSTPAPPQSLTIEVDGDVQVIQNPDFGH